MFPLVPMLATLPPKTQAALQSAINTCSAKAGMPPNWVQRWIAFAVVADALLRTADGTPSPFEFKGGAAIELRLRQKTQGLIPRTSKDLDATFRGPLDEIEGAIATALQRATGDFSFRLKRSDTQPIHMRRYDVAVSYRTKSFASVRLEVSAYEGVYRSPELIPAPSLGAFGIDTAGFWPCLPLTKQVAQKIHAVTETFDDRENERFRDLIDLCLLSVLTPPSAELRAVCEETFTIRRQHAWPPTVSAPDSWRGPLMRLAAEVQLSMQDADEIIGHVERYVGQIASAS